MMVKMRLTRRGRKKLAIFDVIIADARSPRDGRFIEKLGSYNPNTNPATIVLNDDKAFQWLMNGAQPTDTVRAMLSYRGILFRRHLQLGVNKGAITQEQADAKFNAWKEEKDAKILGKVENLTQKKADALKSKMDAETKKKETMAAAIAKKNTPPVTEAPADETPVENIVVAETPVENIVAVENVVVETPVTENVVVETPATENVVETPATETVEETPVTENVAVETPVEGSTTEEDSTKA
ncbi:MAG: 30S ribosomal protein S16 [Verrucomicrobia bacterium]|nr:30S ribosomal protein S16 [Cytophagales bacterium]